MSKKYFYANQNLNHKDVFEFKNLRTGECWDATYENKSTEYILPKVDYCYTCLLRREIPSNFKFKDIQKGDKIEITWDTIHNGKTYRTFIGAFKYGAFKD